MNRRHTTALLFLMLTIHLYAASADSILVEFNTLWNTVRQPAWQNPALHGKAFNSSLTQLYAKADWQQQSEAFVQEKGKGFLLPAAHADTYIRLSDRTAVWGHASYMNGKHYDICWNSTSDYDLLQPYILADSVGGDTDCERYVFEGGYATQLKHWLLGAEMLFRADHEYRDVDPRMRGIVNELTVRLGAGYEALGYSWSAAIEGNVYKQSNSVDFYRELGVSPEYHEAAIVDGAGPVRRFFKIVFPMITPIFFFNLINQTIGAFQAFNSSYLITQGKPLNTTLYYGVHLYNRAFTYYEMGYGSAMAWFMLLVIAIFTALIFRSSSAWVYYESEGK